MSTISAIDSCIKIGGYRILENMCEEYSTKYNKQIRLVTVTVDLATQETRISNFVTAITS